MSATVDAQRKEEAFEARLERAKKQMLLDQAVLRAMVNGLSERTTALELGVSRYQLRAILVHLHLRPQPNQHRRAVSHMEAAHV